LQAAIADELAQRGLAMDFAVVSNPEFLKEGAAAAAFLRPERVVIGADDERAALLMRSLYAPFVRNHDRVLVMDRRSAEFIKYAAKAMLSTRIDFPTRPFDGRTGCRGGENGRMQGRSSARATSRLSRRPCARRWCLMGAICMSRW